MKSTTIAVDVAKEVLEVAVSVRPGQVSEQKRLSRAAFMKFCTDQPPATVLLEACGSAHYWGRRLQSIGHRVVLLPPHATRPYVFRNKTDRTDTRGLLEAFRNEDIHPVPVKSVSQQALTALHRLRSTWLATRTARINTVRGLLREFGCTIPVGAHHVLTRTWDLLADADSGLPDALRPALAAACTEIRDMEGRIHVVEDQLKALADQTPAVARLRSIPGVGLLTATALVAFVGDVQRFPSGRHFASYLGLTPRERSSGLVRRLGAMAMSISACSSSTAHAPSSGLPRSAPPPTACASGLCISKNSAVTTKPPSPSPTSWPASSGPSGSTTSTSGR